MDDQAPALERRGGRRAWLILLLLMAATITNLVDRQLPFILGAQLKREFSLSDAQLGMLGGIAFSMVYALGAIPLARLADQGSRKVVLGICMAVWSGMTALGAFAHSFLALALTRSGVALGEAAASPVSHSMIADLFEERQRGLAIAAFTASVPIGIMLGMGMGGVLAERFDWREILLMAALPGLVLSAITLIWLREPARIGPVARRTVPFRTSIADLVRKRSFVWVTVATTLITFVGAGAATFGALFMIRSWGFSVGQAGIVFGIVFGGAGIVGGLLNGILTDRLVRRDIRWRLWLPAMAMIAVVPPYAIAWLTGDPRLGLAMMALAFMLKGCYLSASYTAVQSIAAPNSRASASAALQLVINLIGNVLGPVLFGALSDVLQPQFGDRALGYALAWGALLPMFAGLAYARAATFLPGDVAATGRAAAA